MTGWTASFIEVRLVFALDVTRASRAVVAALEAAPWPAPAEWRSPYEDDGPMRRDPLRDYLASNQIRSLEWNHGRIVEGMATANGTQTVVELQLSDTEIDHCWRWLVASEELIHRLVAPGTGLLMGRVRRIGSGAKCLPELTTIGGPTHVFAAIDEVFDEVFDDVDPAVAAGGWDARRMGTYRVLARAMHAETNVELLEAIWEGQWAMARLARPGAASYDVAAGPEANELGIFRAGERRLLSAGYDEDQRAAMFTCLLEPEQHVQPWEVWTLGQALHRKVLPSGEAIDAIRVIFADRASAQRERRPLLEVGVTVQHYGDDGALVTLPRDP